MAAYMQNFCQCAIRCSRQISKNERFMRFIKATHRLMFTNVILLRKSEELIFRKMFARFSRSKQVLSAHRFILGACMFSWAQDKITDEEIKNTLEDITYSLKESSRATPSKPQTNSGTEDSPSPKTSDQQTHIKKSWLDQCMGFITDDWENILQTTTAELWRRPMEGKDIYEYKMIGTFDDISVHDFLTVQMDFVYRREWDQNVIKLDVIDRDERSGNEVVHWVSHYPYPMRHREYIYVRRVKVDPTNGRVVILSRAIADHPEAKSPNGFKPEDFVRVVEYESTMVLEPHTGYNQNGLTYFLSYYDDPQSNFPRVCYNYLATSGIPQYHEKLHKAAKDLRTSKLIHEGEVLFN